MMEQIEEQIRRETHESFGQMDAVSPPAPKPYGRPLPPPLNGRTIPRDAMPASDPTGSKTLVDCRDFAEELTKRAHGIVETISDHANLVSGHATATNGGASAGARPSNGAVSDLWDHLYELSSLMNAMVHENGRLGRALS